jgi:2-keto-3-deoxy-L-fuconate dehydrogenase
MKRLEGKTILVTAAGAGIGRASALAMAAEGAQVWATDLNGTLLQSLADTPGVETAVLDVLDKSAIAAMAARIGAVDVLFNCTGFVHNDTALKATDEDLDFAFRLNVRSHLHMIQAVLPGMIAKGGGSIINMASVASSVRGLPSRCVYGTTKAAVIGLTKSVAADYVGQGVRCNAICPGFVRTPLAEAQVKPLADKFGISEEAALRDHLLVKQPSRRWIEVEDIARMALYLCGPGSGAVNGAALSIDGGWLAA